MHTVVGAGDKALHSFGMSYWLGFKAGHAASRVSAFFGDLSYLMRGVSEGYRSMLAGKLWQPNQLNPRSQRARLAQKPVGSQLLSQAGQRPRLMRNSGQWHSWWST